MENLNYDSHEIACFFGLLSGKYDIFLLAKLTARGLENSIYLVNKEET